MYTLSYAAYTVFLTTAFSKVYMNTVPCRGVGVAPTLKDHLTKHCDLSQKGNTKVYLYQTYGRRTVTENSYDIQCNLQLSVKGSMVHTWNQHFYLASFLLELLTSVTDLHKHQTVSPLDCGQSDAKPLCAAFPQIMSNTLLPLVNIHPLCRSTQGSTSCSVKHGTACYFCKLTISDFIHAFVFVLARNF